MRLQGALLGAGNIALRGHAPQWTGDDGLRREATIVAVADLSPSNLEVARELFPEARLYPRAEELLAAETLDFCDICTPPFTHRPLVETAASRGIHVVCEKPLAATQEDAEAIVSAVRRSEIVFRPCHQYHFSPQWQALKRLLPRIGRVYLAEHDVQRTGANPGNPNWAPEWRTERTFAGGGILVDHGAHIFYQLRSVLGEPRTVQATVRRLRHRGYEVEDTAFVILDFGEALARVSLTWAARRRAVQFRFIGERGEIFGDEERVIVQADTTEEVPFDHGMSQDSSHSGWYAPLLRGFLQDVRVQDRGSQALEEALFVSRLIARAYASSEEGRALPLTEPALQEDPDASAASAVSLSPRAYAVQRHLVAEPAGSDPEAEAHGESTLASAPVLSVPQAGTRRRTWALRGATALVLLMAVVWTFQGLNWRETWNVVASANLGWIALAALVNLGVVFFQSARWLALVKPLSRGATMVHAFKSMVMGFAVSTVVPARAGELARIEWFHRQTGLARMSIVGSIVLDNLVNAAGLLAGLAALPFLFRVPLWLRPWGIYVFALFLVGVAAVLALRPANQAHADRVASQRLPMRGVAAFLAQARQGLVATRSPRALGISLGVSLVAWALEANVTILSMRAVDLHLPLVASLLVLLAVNLALAFPFAPPGNMGTLEIGATLALVQGFRVAKEQALAFALCYHFLQVVPIGILGLILAARAGYGPARGRFRAA